MSFEVELDAGHLKQRVVRQCVIRFVEQDLQKVLFRGFPVRNQAPQVVEDCRFPGLVVQYTQESVAGLVVLAGLVEGYGFAERYGGDLWRG